MANDRADHHFLRVDFLSAEGQPQRGARLREAVDLELRVLEAAVQIPARGTLAEAPACLDLRGELIRVGAGFHITCDACDSARGEGHVDGAGHIDFATAGADDAAGEEVARGVVEKHRQRFAVHIHAAAGNGTQPAGTDVVEIDLRPVDVERGAHDQRVGECVVRAEHEAVGIGIIAILCAGGVAVAPAILDVGEPRPAGIAVTLTRGAADQIGIAPFAGVVCHREHIHALHVEGQAADACAAAYGAQAPGQRFELRGGAFCGVAALRGRFFAGELAKKGQVLGAGVCTGIAETIGVCGRWDGVRVGRGIQE